MLQVRQKLRYHPELRTSSFSYLSGKYCAEFMGVSKKTMNGGEEAIGNYMIYFMSQILPTSFKSEGSDEQGIASFRESWRLVLEEARTHHG